MTGPAPREGGGSVRWKHADGNLRGEPDGATRRGVHQFSPLDCVIARRVAVIARGASPQVAATAGAMPRQRPGGAFERVTVGTGQIRRLNAESGQARQVMRVELQRTDIAGVVCIADALAGPAVLDLGHRQQEVGGDALAPEGCPMAYHYARRHTTANPSTARIRYFRPSRDPTAGAERYGGCGPNV